jgi:Outer membrane protein
MSRYFRLIVLAIVLVVAQVAAQAQYTLDGSISKARENYPAIKRYKIIETTAGYLASNAGKSYLPQITLSAKGTYQSDVTSVPVNIPGVTIPTLSKDQYGVTLNIEQTIWDGGAVLSAKEEISAKRVADENELEVELYAIKERVTQLYLGILLIDGYLKELEVLKEDLKRGRSRIEAYIESGVANSSDLDAFLAEEIALRQREMSLLSDREAYIDMLGQMTGENIAKTASLERPNMSVDDFEIRRPELQMFASHIALLDSRKKGLDARNMPKFGLFVQTGYGKPALNMFSNKFEPYYIAGVRMVWNIGGFYTKSNELKLIDLQKSAIQISSELFLYNINLKSAGERAKIEKLQKLLESDKELVELRTNLLKAADTKLVNGTVSTSDYLKELSNLDGARSSKARREIELLGAINDLKNSLNR